MKTQCKKCGLPHPGCNGHNRAGEPCKRRCGKGAPVCHQHGGATPKVLAHAAIRVEVESWGLGAPTVDPGETLLRLLSQSAARVTRYGALLAEAYRNAEAGQGSYDGMPAAVRALIGHKYVSVGDGERIAVGEAIRGLVELEAAERDRCARFAHLGLAAGLDERLVRLAERQIDTLDAVLRLALDRAGLSPADRARVIDAVPLAITELVGGAR